jgi:hypothetical protein
VSSAFIKEGVENVLLTRNIDNRILNLLSYGLINTGVEKMNYIKI